MLNKEQKEAVKWKVKLQNPNPFIDDKFILNYVLDNYGDLDIDSAVTEYRQFLVDETTALIDRKKSEEQTLKDKLQVVTAALQTPLPPNPIN